MKILFYGSVIDYANGENFFDSKNSSNIRTLIDELGNHFGQSFKEFLLGDGTCFFLVNGKGIMTIGGIDTKICPEDKVEILPFVEAG
ncbi:MAG: MoaD/ThiS family protein [Defluviitaleaceae bacterium]|nr:MoaD/ThiS family protein [Defluviitaleaceae bacterium]